MKRFFSIAFYTLPRLIFSYPFYLFPSLMAVKPDKKSGQKLLLLVVWMLFSFLMSSLAANVSITAVILSLALQLPFFLFIFKFPVAKKVNAFGFMRSLNFWLMVFSFLNMILFWGFPFRLPYRDYLPDAYGAFYGKGGAKIVTSAGFFGIVGEVFRQKDKGTKGKVFHLTIAIMNFIIPSYLTGIIMGIGALGIVTLRKKIYLLPFVILLVLIVLPYALERFQILNDDFSRIIGYNPKIFAYISVLELYGRYPMTILFGTSPGQFTGTPALWSSAYLSALSTHEIPHLPGLYMSDYHQQILGPVFSQLSDDTWALGSSANKPYNSVTTMLAEYGLAFSILIVHWFMGAFRAMGFHKKYTLCIFFFAAFCFATDLWHDSLWFCYLLILSSKISEDAT